MNMVAGELGSKDSGGPGLMFMQSNGGLTDAGLFQDNAEESVRRVLDVLQDCSFTYPMDGGSNVVVSIKVNKTNREAIIDFSGTSPQHSGNYNAPTAVCKAAVL